MVDKDRARSHARESAVIAQADRAQVVVISDAGHHEIRALGGFAGGFRGLSAVFLGPGFGLGEGAVEDRYLVTGGLEMTGQREAHDPQTQKRHFRHLVMISSRSIVLDFP